MAIDNLQINPAEAKMDIKEAQEIMAELKEREAMEDEWELQEGIPQFSDPFIQKYFQGRDALIAQEAKHRNDQTFRELLSPMAQEACAIVSQIRFEEQQTLWTEELEDDLAKQYGAEVHPGMKFILAKERMQRSKLWQIVHRMPKGALLHCHLEAMIDFHWTIRRAKDQACGLQTTLRTTWCRYRKPPTAFLMAGKAGFIEWLVSRSSISTEESMNHHHGPMAILAQVHKLLRTCE
ncbi:hypothetical protein MRB53_041409 [Persea americana]|nr:hypothetical protein MRB53_041409 [Persea americana]